ncbi:MAG: SIMPL domain-containing protein [Actinomycetota bacterium]
MTRLTRLLIVLTAVALVGGSSLAAVAVGQNRSSRSTRQTLEARIAALEAASKARLEGIGNELSGLRQAVSSDGNTVKVAGEAYLPTSLNAVVVAYRISPTRPTVGDALSTAQRIASLVTKAVHNAGVSSADIRTVWDTTFPSYEKQGWYTAQARVLTTVRDISRLDRVTAAAKKVSAAVGVGYLNVSDESNTKALEEAREKAQRYARAAGRKLGKLVSISEQVAPESSPATPGGDEGGYSYRPAFIVVVDAVYELA